MSFFDDSHVMDLPGASKPARRVGFLEGFDIGFDQQYRVDSPYSLASEIEDDWLTSVTEYERVTGERLDLPMGLGKLTEFARELQGKEQSFWSKNPFTGNFDRQDLDKLIAANEKIKGLGIKSFDTILDETIAMQQQVEGRTQEAGGTLGTLGTFVGGVAGSFTGRDPVNLLTLGIGGFGRGIATKIATEAGIAGTIAAVTDSQAVNPNREIAGLEARSPLESALFAAVGAGAIRGAGELVPILARRVARIGEPQIDVDFRDAQLASMFAANPQSPRARAGLDLLEGARELEGASPYGLTRAGMARFVAELDDVARVLDGGTETALARIPRPELPFEQIERAADFEIVKQRSPKVWARVEQAQARIAEIDARVTELEQSGINSMADAVRLVDEDAAARIEQIELRLAEPDVPEPERIALATEANAIAQRVGPERVMKAVDDAEIAPAKERQRLAKQRKARNKEYRQAVRAAERERDQIKTVERLVARTKQAEALNLFGPGITQPQLGMHLRYDVVEREATRITRDAELSDDAAEALVRMNEPASPEGILDRVTRALGRQPPEGKIDIGLDEPIDPDFIFDINGTEMTARQIMDDLHEDVRLDEASRSCML